MSDIHLLLGHRGALAFTSIPWNSFASFDLAIEQGCDGFEFDVRLTGCGRALVCHNPKIGSVTVSRARANQLRDLPQLEEVIERYSNRVFLDIKLIVRGLERNVFAELHTSQRHYDHAAVFFVIVIV